MNEKDSVMETGQEVKEHQADGTVLAGEDSQTEETVPKKDDAWLDDLKGTLERAIHYHPEEAAAQEDQEQAPPAPSKDELQKQLAAMKADFTHTPMELTPDLEKLLAEELKAEKKNTKRAAQMISVLAKHNFYANGLTPEELRTTLEDLGPTYVKIGQIMSSRVDLLPEIYCKELEKLRQNVKELDPAISRAVIEAETGRKIDEIYSEFRDAPIGSASIGQVHYGVLKDGTKVVTKVQRPLIAEMMQKDFDLLKKLAPLLDGDEAGKDPDALSLGSIIDEFEKVTKEELDFRIEAANTKFFREVVLPHGHR